MSTESPGGSQHRSDDEPFGIFDGKTSSTLLDVVAQNADGERWNRNLLQFPKNKMKKKKRKRREVGCRRNEKNGVELKRKLRYSKRKRKKKMGNSRSNVLLVYEIKLWLSTLCTTHYAECIIDKLVTSPSTNPATRGKKVAKKKGKPFKGNFVCIHQFVIFNGFVSFSQIF